MNDKGGFPRERERDKDQYLIGYLKIIKILRLQKQADLIGYHWIFPSVCGKKLNSI